MPGFTVKPFVRRGGGCHFPGRGNAMILNSTALQRKEEVEIPGKDRGFPLVTHKYWGAHVPPPLSDYLPGEEERCDSRGERTQDLQRFASEIRITQKEEPSFLTICCIFYFFSLCFFQSYPCVCAFVKISGYFFIEQ